MRPRRKIEPWLFLLPALAVYIGVVLFPMAGTIGYSFLEWNGIGEKKFIGFDNYVRMFTDKTLRAAFFNNLFFMLVGTAFQMIMGLLMATLLSGIRKGSNIFRVLYFIPCIISSMAICKIFEKLLSVQPRGVISVVMELLNMKPIAFLSEFKYALTCVTLIDGYKFCGLYMVIFYAALMNVPQETVEAAYIDGCSWMQAYFKVKLPAIKNMFFIVLVILVNGCLKGFDVSYILTGGGPGNATELVATYMYKTAFSMSNFGYGSTLAVFILIESLIAVGIVKMIQKKFSD